MICQKSGLPVAKESSHTATPLAAVRLILSFVWTVQPYAARWASICSRAFSSGVMRRSYVPSSSDGL